MLESFKSSTFEYKKLTEEEQQKRGILGRLVGPIADYKNPTRNGRKYTEKLWEKVFTDPIVKEKIENKCLYGELGHPEDRLETDMAKICICLAEVPKKSSDGKLYGIFDVLDTPNGRILKTLLDYGTTIGVSSRGEGDLISDGYLGEEIVDPDTYQFECWDAVILPAVKAARVNVVTESLTKNKTLKQALLEDINRSSDNDKLVMNDTLESLGIDLTEGIQYKGYDMTITQSGVQLRKSDGTFVQEFPTEQEAKEYVDEMNESLNEGLTYAGYKVELSNNGVVLSHGNFKKEFRSLDSAVDYANSNPLNESLQEEESSNESSIKDVNIQKKSEKEEADDDGDDLVAELQETLLRNADLEKLVKSLQERLSVCYAKEKRHEGQLNTYKGSIQSLQESAKKASSLEERISSLEKIKKSLEEQLSRSKSTNERNTKQINSLRESVRSLKEEHKEKIDGAEEIVSTLADKVTALQEELNRVRSENSTSIKTLQESYTKKESGLNNKLADLQKDSRMREKQLTEKLQKVSAEADRYKAIAQKAIDKYITEKCTALGISSTDVKNRLGSSYSFNDISRICEDLSSTKIAVDRLPFRTSKVNNIAVKEEVRQLGRNEYNDGDYIDPQLTGLLERLT